VGRRQQHIDFKAETVVQFAPQSASECAGIVILQNEEFHYRCVYTLNKAGNTVLRIIRRADGDETLIVEQPVHAEKLYLKIEAHGQDYGFYYAVEPDNWQTLIDKVDGRILSTPVAGGFVGAMIGMYASSNGQPSENAADFDYFEYHELIR
jgi:alpha-N-arabinofuranosidase